MIYASHDLLCVDHTRGFTQIGNMRPLFTAGWKHAPLKKRSAPTGRCEARVSTQGGLGYFFLCFFAAALQAGKRQDVVFLSREYYLRASLTASLGTISSLKI